MTTSLPSPPPLLPQPLPLEVSVRFRGGGENRIGGGGRLGGRVHCPYRRLPLLQPLEGDTITSLEAARLAEDGINDKYDPSLSFAVNISPPHPFLCNPKANNDDDENKQEAGAARRWRERELYKNGTSLELIFSSLSTPTSPDAEAVVEYP